MLKLIVLVAIVSMAVHSPSSPTQPELALTNVNDFESPVGNWLLQSINGNIVLAHVKSTMNLSQDGSLSGSGGCNRMTGKAALNGSNIKFGNIASTRMACLQGEMDQEHKFFTAMDTVREWRLDERGAKLILLNEKAEPVLAFLRQ
ncbi:MAG: META domain-containing protein [Mesorhizobium sp.]